MKKWFCCFLVALTAIFVFSSCGFQNSSQPDIKLCYLEDSQTALLTPKDTIVEKKGWVYSEEYDNYSYPEGESVTIGKIPFLASFQFNSEDILAYAFYVPADENSSTLQMDETKEYLDSIYGPSEEYANEYDEEGYSWIIETEKGNYRIALVESLGTFRIDVEGITGDVRTDSKKSLEEANSRLDEAYSEFSEKWEGVGEAASEFYEGIQDSSGVTFYEIEPETGVILQEQFDNLEDGMTYPEAMEALGASENPAIPSDASQFSCKWETDSAFVMLLFSNGELVSYQSYGLM